VATVFLDWNNEFIATNGEQYRGTRRGVDLPGGLLRNYGPWRRAGRGNRMKQTGLALLISVVFGLAGCAPVLIGGGAAAGYYVGKDERTLGEITDDANITAKIKTKYIADKAISAWDINVDTYRGVVSLYGRVPSQEVANRAVTLARGVEGVRQVNSKLTVDAKK